MSLGFRRTFRHRFFLPQLHPSEKRRCFAHPPQKSLDEGLPHRLDELKKQDREQSCMERATRIVNDRFGHMSQTTKDDMRDRMFKVLLERAEANLPFSSSDLEHGTHV